MFWIQLALVLLCIVLGSRLGGVGMGKVAALGTAVLIFGFGLPAGSLPVDVLFIIIAVVAAAASLQAAGGLTLMVQAAERLLRRQPRAITLVAPLVAFLFTFVSGTGHVAYSLLPVIAEVARNAGIRPERPMSISVIASQQAITASPISAATAGMIALLAHHGLGLRELLLVSVPATLVGVVLGALSVWRMGVELSEDPVYLDRLARGLVQPPQPASGPLEPQARRRALEAIALFGVAALLVVFLGLFPALRQPWSVPGAKALPMAQAIQVVMLGSAALILWRARVTSEAVVRSSVAQAGVVAVVSVFGLAWLGSTFFEAHQKVAIASIAQVIQHHPWVFALGLFLLSVLLYSQAATVAALMGVGLALGIPPKLLIAFFPAVNGYFFLPTYATQVAAIHFDTTGTTRIGRWLLDHSFMRPGLVATAAAVATGMLITRAL